MEDIKKVFVYFILTSQELKQQDKLSQTPVFWQAFDLAGEMLLLII